MSQITLSSVLALTPEIGLLILAVLVLLVDRGLQPGERRRLGLWTAWGSLVILLATFGLWLFFNEPGDQPQLIWGGMIRHDGVTLVFRVMFLIALTVTSLISMDVKNLQQGEYYALLISSTIGLSLMAAAGDLIMLYVALETASLSLYVLAGYAKNVSRSAEAGMKYFVYGAFASALMLYGFSLLYGLTQETNLYVVSQSVIQQPDVAMVGAAILVVVGFGFKISAVPFHFWAPDVYEGAPTPVTGFVSTASKAAGFAVFLRVFLAGTLGTADPAQAWWIVLISMCIITMTVGNLLAIFQTNIKRLLAYSSIAQAGYTMIGLVTLSQDGSGAAMFYLLYYVVSNIAAFGVIILFSNLTGSDELKDLSGLSRRSPYLALAMLFALLSLGGIPPTAGFFGKFFLFKAAVDAGMWGLALVGILNAFIALYYYLSVAKYIYLYRSEEEDVPIPVSRAAQVALGVTVFGILYLGIVAGPAFEWTRQAAAAFFAG
ncbi:MAG: NADH-quinone oxidoreductase subunit N [Chloroflexi bacterium]|nr:NADH-quinone oxidoreductase subunit N [Chloroflexota bacterium]MCI0649438.1 NADH-quinone oxidoreductase subunit N [Chloroflexota bacterium]MCI0730762.1 NADH-quinone oxidoreductase subunit N [Chloroflexota bacterium]